MTFRDRIATYIASENLLSPGAKVIVGLSGGADSSALLAVLCELGYTCHAVHCHFGLRAEEADRDLEFSRVLASQLGAEFSEVRFNTKDYQQVHGVSLEMACRELRYEHFEQLRVDLDAQAIAVGHHQEDNIETFFLNLLRGSGMHGLKAMLPKRDNIVRPLLGVSKRDILDYLAEINVDFIEDSSNKSNDFKRNKLRNIVIPMLEEQFPGATESILRSIDNLRSQESLYNSLLPARSNSLQNVNVTLLYEWLSPFGFNISQCNQMLTANSGAQFVSQTHIVTICSNKTYELVELGTEVQKPHIEGIIYPKHSDFKFHNNRLYLDAGLVPLNANWRLRKCKDGDKIKPFGMKGKTKLVNDILAEVGISSTKRRDCYVLTLDDVILWVVGYRSSAYYNITEATKNVIEIRIV